jgi:HAE1 family hydrophobic/amphiphilic exporter-1
MKSYRPLSLYLAIFSASLYFGAGSPVFGQEPVVSQGSTANISSSAPAVKTPDKRVLGDGSGIDLTRVGVQTAQPISLSLNEAIRKALERNNDIEIARDDVRFQETQLRSLQGIYDPVFTATPNYTRNSTTGSAATNDFRVNSNITTFIRPGGGNYQVFFNNSRTENAFAQAQVSSGSIASVGSNAIYSSSLGVTFTQPLFRNFRIDTKRQQIKIAKKRLQQTDADFRRRTIETISQVQRSYWDLVFALRDQQNRVANLNLTKENLRQIEAKIEAGAAAPLERAEVATELANREADLLIATQQISIAENALKQLILREPSSVEWTQSFVPTDKPLFNLDPMNLDDAMKDAVANRFELSRLRLQKEINSIDVSYYKNQTKPQIDLNSTFSLGGLSRGGVTADSFTVPLISSDPFAINTNANAFLLSEIRRLNPNATILVPDITIPGTPSFLAGGFNRSLANLFRSDAPNYSVGVTISFPFRNRTAEANLAGARIQGEQIDAQIRAQEQAVVVEVRNAVQAVETSRQRVLVARRARENAEIQLEGERKLYEVGKSTTFLLFQRENSLTNARNDEIRAETDYNKALSDLQKATSTTFQVNNIEVESPTDNK